MYSHQVATDASGDSKPRKGVFSMEVKYRGFKVEM